MNGTIVFARAGAIGFFINLAMHTMALVPVRRSAMTSSKDIVGLVTLLWLMFSVALLVIGLIVWVHARPSPLRKPVLFLAGLFPVATAVGQLMAFGWIFPEATLVLTGLLTLVAAFTEPPLPRSQPS